MNKESEIADFTLKVRRSTANRLKEKGNAGDTSDSVLRKILDFYEKYHNK